MNYKTLINLPFEDDSETFSFTATLMRKLSMAGLPYKTTSTPQGVQFLMPEEFLLEGACCIVEIHTNK